MVLDDAVPFFFPLHIVGFFLVLSFLVPKSHAVSLFRFCSLRRTEPLCHLKVSPSERPSNAASTVVKWDSLAFGAFSGCVTRCSRFYPYVTISAAQTRKSDNLRHAMSLFSVFLSSFSGAQRILGYGNLRRIVANHPLKIGKRRPPKAVSRL